MQSGIQLLRAYVETPKLNPWVNRLVLLLNTRSVRFFGIASALALMALAACAPAPRVSETNDPFETQNRKMHEINKKIDKAVLKPLSGAYGTVAGGPMSQGVGNFSSNLSLPGMILNDILQLNLPDAFSNLARFSLNSTFGIAGIFDVATPNNLPEASTNFGETLHVWGVAEGSFIELPFYGASTGRDAVGLVVDFIIDPVNYVLPTPERYIGTASHLASKVGDRGRYSDLVESVLYESEDSYAQSRLLYLQSRRRALYGELSDDDLEDPYAE